MKKKLPILFAVMLCVTFVSHILFYYFGTAVNLAEGTEFFDYDSLIAYMEQDTGADVVDSDELTPLMTADGKVICEFHLRNTEVRAIVPADNDDGLPITVYSCQEFDAALQIRSTVNLIFIVLYPLELITALLAARKVRAQQTN